MLKRFQTKRNKLNTSPNPQEVKDITLRIERQVRRELSLYG